MKPPYDHYKAVYQSKFVVCSNLEMGKGVTAPLQ